MITPQLIDDVLNNFDHENIIRTSTQKKMFQVEFLKNKYIGKVSGDRNFSVC